MTWLAEGVVFDCLRGDGSLNRLVGGPGNDTLQGGGGNDELVQ
jgi:Ca2+-binding RTX toxin-like protein